ncbi:hypothetical protein OHB26_16930 [Nocardia sp. NBC_01503]|uniref:hypothetical protein n=1 Tax=Nocardia sp. NBC_01503 TaxID=2975997 RepID=UPI002E7B516C|nr:hypothetical protein [Nocardia sp. NBC_01503]WTL35730.1 hypothetical protein OHB26_16930 [Nocardia sp. NBC_01503]
MTEVSASHRFPAAPEPVRAPLLSLAYRAIVVALLAGAGETVLRAGIALADPDTNAGGLVYGLLIRAAIYLTVLTVAVRMAAGIGWARIALILGLGTVGLASLLVEPIGAVLSGELSVDWSVGSVAIGALRTVHIVAVLVAVPAMVRAGMQVRQRG